MILKPLPVLTIFLRLGFVLVRGVPVERGPVPKLQVDSCIAAKIFSGHYSPSGESGF